MRFVVYGAGAVGGVLGGLLVQAGYDVTLVARGAHLDAIRTHGLRVESPESVRTLAVTAVAGPEQVDWEVDDVVLLTVKSNDTLQAVTAVAAAAGPGTPVVVCAQNGVANEPTALRFVERVLGMCVMMPAAHLQPGVVEVHSTPVPGILDVGAYPRGVDEPATRVAATLTAAGFVSQPRPDIMSRKYRKLMMSLGNAVHACCVPGPAADELLRRVGAEGETVLRAAGIDAVTEQQDRERRGDILRLDPIGGRDRPGGSSWQSLERATGSIEADYLNGEVVLLGRLHGVPTPANELLRHTATAMARERARPATLDAADLLRRLDR